MINISSFWGVVEMLLLQIPINEATWPKDSAIG